MLAALYLGTHAIMGVVSLAAFDGVEPASPLTAAHRSEPRSSARSPRTTAGRRPAPDLAERILDYNPFCPGCAPEPEAQALGPTEPAPPGVTLLDPREVETELPLELVATMEVTPPGHSLATIASEGAVGLFEEGEEVSDGVTLLAVDTGLVHLRVGDRLEFLRTDRPPPPKPKPGSRPGTKRPRPKSKYEIEGASDAIECKGNSCTVDRRFVAKLMAQPGLLTRQARVRAYSRKGLKGFRLSRVRRGTLPRLLGLRSGDVLTAVNGQQLESLDGAMKLYSKLRSAKHLTVEYVRSRRGERQAMRLNIDIV